MLNTKPASEKGYLSNTARSACLLLPFTVTCFVGENLSQGFVSGSEGFAQTWIKCGGSGRGSGLFTFLGPNVIVEAFFMPSPTHGNSGIHNPPFKGRLKDCEPSGKEAVVHAPPPPHPHTHTLV